MINLNTNVNSVMPMVNPEFAGTGKVGSTDMGKNDFGDTIKNVGKYISETDDLQQSSDMSIKDLLAGKNEDINSVIAAAAKADMSFKLLVGVRNKLIDAYKQTMNMSI